MAASFVLHIGFACLVSDDKIRTRQSETCACNVTFASFRMVGPAWLTDSGPGPRLSVACEGKSGRGQAWARGVVATAMARVYVCGAGLPEH